MISKQTAMDIALAYREIETAEELLAKITEAMQHREVPDLRDVFGRRRGGLQLGVPSGDDSRHLFDIPWSMAKPVLETHIAQQRATLAVLNEKARIEAENGESNQ